MGNTSQIFGFIGAACDFTAVFGHGLVGYRMVLSPLDTSRLLPTRGFGDADMSRRALVVTWHIVTAVFACCSVAFFLVGLGAVTGSGVPLLLMALHGSFVGVAVALVGRRAPIAFRRPIPILFGLCMTLACLSGGLASS